MTERLVLVGMMGAGKSTVGRAVAEGLGWRFVDLDEVVAAAAGMSVAELFASGGEDAFRVAEAAALAREIADDGGTAAVVSAGGGVVLDPDNRARLRQADTVVWLRAAPETLADRVGDAAGRPLLAGAADRAARLAEIAAERASLYEEVADVVIDVDDLTVEEVAARVRAGRGARRPAQGSRP